MDEKKTKVAIVLIMVAVLIGGLFIGVLASNNPSTEQNNENKISGEEAALKTENYIRNNMFDLNNAQIIGVEDAGDLWLVRVDLDGDGVEVVDAYVSKDGAYFIPAAYKFETDNVVSGPSEPAPSADLSTIPLVDDKVNIVYFWGDGCGFCEQMNEFLTDLDSRMPGSLNIIKYETWKDQDNVDLMRAMSANYGLEPRGVPLVFIGDEYFVGSSDDIHESIEEYLVSNCLGQLDICQVNI